MIFNVFLQKEIKFLENDKEIHSHHMQNYPFNLTSCVYNMKICTFSFYLPHPLILPKKFKLYFMCSALGCGCCHFQKILH